MTSAQRRQQTQGGRSRPRARAVDGCAGAPGRVDRAAARRAPRRGTGRQRDSPQTGRPTRRHQQERQADQLDPARHLNARRASDSAHRGDASRADPPVQAPGLGLVVSARRRRSLWSLDSLKEEGAFATVPRMSPPGDNRRASSRRATTLRRRGAPGTRAATAPSCRLIVARRRWRLATLLLSALGGWGTLQAPRRPRAPSRLLPGGPTAAQGGHRQARDTPPAASGQPVARDGDRLPGWKRRSDRARTARHPGEPGAAEARWPRDLRRLVGPPALVPAARRTRAGRRRRSTWARARAPTSTRRSTGLSSRSRTSS